MIIKKRDNAIMDHVSRFAPLVTVTYEQRLAQARNELLTKVEQNDPELTLLETNRICFTAVDLLRLAAGLAVNTNVNKLDFNNLLSDEKFSTSELVQIICTGLETNIGVTSLCFGPGRNFSIQDLRTVLKLCSKNLHLKHLDLYAQNLGLQAAYMIGRFLSVNRSLLNLNLSYNNFSNQGIAYIFAGLANNAILKEINLNYCRIDNDCIGYVMQVLASENNRSALEKLIMLHETPRAFPYTSSYPRQNLYGSIAAYNRRRERLADTTLRQFIVAKAMGLNSDGSKKKTIPPDILKRIVEFGSGTNPLQLRSPMENAGVFECQVTGNRYASAFLF